jgi:hypothetical protein
MFGWLKNYIKFLREDSRDSYDFTPIGYCRDSYDFTPIGYCKVCKTPILPSCNWSRIDSRYANGEFICIECKEEALKQD